MRCFLLACVSAIFPVHRRDFSSTVGRIFTVCCFPSLDNGLESVHSHSHLLGPGAHICETPGYSYRETEQGKINLPRHGAERD